MIDSLLLILFINYLIHAAASGLVGYVIAVRAGKNPVIAAAVAALLPWLGVILLMFTTPRQAYGHQSRSRVGWVYGGCCAVGALLLLVSLMCDWADLSAKADQYHDTVGGGPGDSGTATTVVVLVALAWLALGLAGWQHGGLRFAIPAAWVTASTVALIADLVIASSMLDSLVTHVRNLSGDWASATVGIGLGTWLALLAAVIALVGALTLVWSNRSAFGFTPSGPLAMASSAQPTSDPWADGTNTTSGWELPPAPPSDDGWGR